MTPKHITIVAFAGPSGAGKTELAKRLLELYPDNLTKWKQATTRQRRDAADDYVFMTKGQYDVIRTTLTCRTEFNGNSYGTFPEPTPADTAVLTIADVMGMTDLMNDVDSHNRRVLDGHAGKFGELPVRLVTVLVCYDLDDTTVSQRGRGSRGVEFISHELEMLRDAFNFDHVVNTTSEWPDPAAFFESAIWPAICLPFGGDRIEDIHAKIEHELIEIGEACGAINEIEILREVLERLRTVTQWTLGQHGVISHDVTVDPIDDVLGAAPMVIESASDESIAYAEAQDEDGDLQYPTDYLNDRVEPPPAAPVQDASEIASVEAEAPTEEQLVTSEVTAVETDVAETPVPEESIVGESVAEEVSASTAELVPYAEIFANYDVTDWMLQNAIGLEAFENDSMFKTIFSQFVSAHGGNPNDIQVESTTDRDGKNGIIRKFVAVMADGSRFGLEFNERLKRAVNYGPL